jgi:hypothetical protein
MSSEASRRPIEGFSGVMANPILHESAMLSRKRGRAVSENESTAKKSAGKAIAVMLAVLILVLSNPSKEQHRDAFRGAVRRELPLASLLGAGRVASWLTDYHSLGVASFSTLDGSVVTFGAFGIVWAAE